MKKIAVFGLVVCLGIWFGTANAFGSAVTGPQKYIRTTGAPNVYTDTFKTMAGDAPLVIQNGEENGENRVTSALIYIDGELLFGPNDFKKKQ